jgi:hypothetical protein
MIRIEEPGNESLPLREMRRLKKMINIMPDMRSFRQT